MSDFLTTGGYLQPATKPKTWHLLWDNQSYELSEHTEAKILHDYLNQHDGSYTLRWQAWSEENDDHAKIFWPVIAQMAKDELYVEIPSVMESVRSPGNIDTFETQLIERVSDIYVARAVDARELGDKVQADALNNQAAQFRFDEDEVNRSKSGETDEPASKEPVLLEKPEVLEQPES